MANIAINTGQKINSQAKTITENLGKPDQIGDRQHQQANP